MAPNISIGVDNGLSGALVAISTSHGKIISMTLMPSENKGEKQVDVEGLIKWFRQFDLSKVECLLETPGYHSPGVYALCSMRECYGTLKGVMASLGIQYQVVAPRTWQAKLIPNCPKGQTKPVALLKAKALWPDEQWEEAGKNKAKLSGLVDAALIAEYARNRRL
jgi:hypothetical protein